MESAGLRKGALGPFQIAFFVMSAAGPLVAFAGGIPVSMLLGNGPGTAALFVIASLILIAFSVGYADMARDVQSTGGFYAFAARGIGGVVGGATGMLALLSYNAMQIGLYGLLGVAAASLAHIALGVTLPWWLFSLAALCLVAFLGYRQVDLSARILGVLIALEYAVIMLLSLAIVFEGGDEGLSLRPFAPDILSLGAPAIGLMFCFAAFVGFEATTIYSEEVRAPETTIPRATYISVVLIGTFYAFGSWAMIMGVGVDKLFPVLRSLPDPTELVFSLSSQYAGGWLSLAMRMLFVTSAFASILAFHNTIARYIFAIGRERLLPVKLGLVHPVHRSPHVASLTQSATALLLLGLFVVADADPILTVFAIPSAIGVLGVIVLMAICAIAILCYLGRNRPAIRTLCPTAIALVMLLAVATLAGTHFGLLAGTSEGVTGILPSFILLALGLGGLAALRLRRRNPAAYARIGYGQQDREAGAS